MHTAIQTAPASKTSLWTGRIISALVVLFMLFDSAIKIMKLAPAVEGTARIGYPVSLVLPIGIVLFVCTVLYAIPRTSILGAILLTGYLGGAVASNVRMGNPLFGYVLFPVYVGVLLWVGLFLRDARLRALIPLRKERFRHQTERPFNPLGSLEVMPMCRNIKTLFNFDPPVTDEEIRAASLQFVRKISGFNRPSKANEVSFLAAVDEVAGISTRLLRSLETNAPPKNREEEAARAKARAAERFGA